MQSPESKPTLTDREEAIRLANKVLDQHWRDPDDDLSTLARNFLRETERTAALSARAPLPPDIEGLVRHLNEMAASESLLSDKGSPAHETWAKAAAAILSLQAQAKAARRTALEQCAEIARSQGCGDPSCRKCVGGDIAAAIRSMIPEEEGTTHG